MSPQLSSESSLYSMMFLPPHSPPPLRTRETLVSLDCHCLSVNRSHSNRLRQGERSGCLSCFLLPRLLGICGESFSGHPLAKLPLWLMVKNTAGLAPPLAWGGGMCVGACVRLVHSPPCPLITPTSTHSLSLMRVIEPRASRVPGMCHLPSRPLFLLSTFPIPAMGYFSRS